MSEVTICEMCRNPVIPGQAGVVYAVKLIRVASMGENDAPMEGLGMFFHEAHFPAGSRSVRRKQWPGA